MLNNTTTYQKWHILEVELIAVHPTYCVLLAIEICKSNKMAEIQIFSPLVTHVPEGGRLQIFFGIS